MENTDKTETPTTLTPDAASDTKVAWEREVIEKMFLESIKEQRAKRRWGIFFKFVGIAVFLMVLGTTYTFNLSDRDTAPMESHVALIKINGTIDSEGKASAKDIIKSLQKAFSEKNTVGVILRINSPGGSPVQSGRIHDEILRLKKLYPNKPLHVVVEDMCASGGYYIAVAADNIYVDKASLVGSIGVLINGFGFNKLIDKIGVERRLLTAGKNKGFMDPFSPQTEQQKQFAQNLIDEVHRQFIEVVRNGRGSRLKENETIFSGLVWTGSQAIELGLVDALGSVESVSREVFKTKTIVDYTEEEKLSDWVLQKLGTSMGEGIAKYGSREWLPRMK